MSEAITKACPNPNCAWARYMAKAPPANCPECNGTGCVPDVEATLRAEVARLTEERNFARTLATDRLEANNVLTAEVERLSQREPTQQECDEAEGKPDATGKTWPAGQVFLGQACRRCVDCGRWAFGGPTRCPYCAGKHDVGVAAQMYLDDLRVANAEVERLEGREREAAQLFYRLLVGEFMESSARVWLAGCKS